MSVSPIKRSVMTLYSGELDPYSHRVRIVLAEKGITVDILDINETPNVKEELVNLNPYGTVPMLMDRDLVIYHADIAMEYLDERFPHPPLMPVYPVARARSRLMMYRVNRDWCSLMDRILAGKESTQQLNVARKELKAGIVSVAPVFAEIPYFLGEEFSLVDCCIAPLLWRLPLMGIVLPPEAQSVLTYADRLFERESFLASLTEAEQAIHPSGVKK